MSRKKKNKAEQILWRIAFLHSEISGIFNSLKYTIRNIEEKSGGIAMAKTEIADLIMQTELLCKQLGLDFEECRKLGKDRYKEKKEEWEEKGLENKWK